MRQPSYPAHQKREVFWLGAPGLRYLGRSYTETAWPPLPPHRYHPDTIGFFFIVKGQQNFRVNQEDHLIRGGDIFVVYPNECHSSGGAPMEKNLFYWMQIDLPIATPPPQQMPVARQYKKPEQPPGTFLNLPRDEGNALAQALLDIRPRHFRGSALVWKLLPEILATPGAPTSSLRNARVTNQTLFLLFEVLDCAKRAATTTTSFAVRAVIRYIDKNLTEPLNIGSLAECARLSVSRFQGKFKAETGLPPREYIVRARVEAAKSRLTHGASVTDVAMALNFPTTQYFATVFKRYTGQTPTAFRQKCLSI